MKSVLENNKNALKIIEVISKLNEEPECITKHRLANWELYLNTPLPDQVQHLWRYSDPAWFEPGNRKINSENSLPEFQINSDSKKQGVILTNLKDAFQLDSHREIIKNHFGKLSQDDPSPSKFTYLNNATWSNGYFLYVPKDVIVKEPVKVKLKNKNANVLESTRILVILDDNSSLSLIDELYSEDLSDLLTNTVIEVFLNKNAKLNYLNFQIHGKETIHQLTHKALLEKNAELTNLIIALGGKTSKANIFADLNGDHASISTYGIVLGEDSQRFDHHTAIKHNYPYTKSLLNFRVALKDKSKSAYTGNLKINHEAIKSDAIQENRNLLLSPNTNAESIPELEILTNDVIRCSHGVTVGQVDKEQIYYLMSRGLSEKDAEKIIIEGFLEPTISRIPEEHLKEKIISGINKKLENL